MANLKDSLSFFKITEEEVKRLISIALSTGGDYADLYFEHTVINNLVLKDKSVNEAATQVDYGVGIRVVKGDKYGYAYSENNSIKELERAALTAAQIVNLSPTPFNKPFKVLPKRDFYPVIKGWKDYSIEQKISYMQEINNRLFNKDKRVAKVTVSLYDTCSHILFFNSNGDCYSDIRPLISIGASCLMQDNKRRERNSVTRSFKMGFEMLNSTIMDYIVDECFNNTEILLKSTQPKGGEMSVVMAKGSSGVLLHEAVGHAFEADFIRNKKSIFSEQLGKQICSKEINIVDDGTIPFNRGALNYDDEGVLTQKTYLVKEGVVNSFLHDRISANHFGIKSTGNGRRESFRCQPIPRMRATYMQSGTCTEESLIKEVKNGIYVTNLSNGQVEIGRGDFTFYVKNGYLIENGKITTPIKDVNIIGSGPQVLKDIIGVANNSLIDNSRWTCGKAQSVEVSCGMPSVLIKKLIVGGYN